MNRPDKPARELWVPVVAPSGGTPAVPHHHETHEDGGSDEVNVGGLSGVLADPQDAGSLQGTGIDPTAPADGETLVYDAGTSLWTPASVGSISWALIMRRIGGRI